MASKYLSLTGLQYLVGKINDLATPVIDSLNSTSTTSALSANQGNVLSGLIGDIGSALDSINGEEEEDG